MPGKRVQIDQETLTALESLAEDRMMTFQEVADEAFACLLKKYHRPADLKSALRESAKESAEDLAKRSVKRSVKWSAKRSSEDSANVIPLHGKSRRRARR